MVMDFSFWAPVAKAPGVELVPPSSPAVVDPMGIDVESTARVQADMMQVLGNQQTLTTPTIPVGSMPAWQQAQADAWGLGEVPPLGVSDFGIPYSPQSGPAGGALGGGATQPTMQIPFADDPMASATVGALGTFETGVELNPTLFSLEPGDVTTLGMWDWLDPVVEFGGELVGSGAAGKLLQKLPIPAWAKVVGTIAGGMVGGGVQSALGLDPGRPIGQLGPGGEMIGAEMANGTTMTRIPSEFQGPMDIGGRAIEQLPGGDPPGLARLVRGIQGATGGNVAKARPVSGMPGAWQGSYWPNPFAKRKRGFFVYPSGMLRTWGYKRHLVISNNPRAKTLARAANKLAKLTSGLVKADTGAKRATKRLKRRKR